MMFPCETLAEAHDCLRHMIPGCAAFDGPDGEYVILGPKDAQEQADDGMPPVMVAMGEGRVVAFGGLVEVMDYGR